MPDSALILVDLQNDFLPGGALAVPDGDAVIPLANELQTHFTLVVATQDWHPPDHVSFATNHPGKKVGDVIEVEGRSQKMWPIHCVQNTRGADFPPELDRRHIAHVVHKGAERQVDSYSGFFDNGRRHGTGLNEYLRGQAVAKVYLAGLATDYCVKFTALDARWLGYEVTLLAAACRGIDSAPGDVQAAIDEMRAAGVAITIGPIREVF
jgi:nicotinamidase/pyrazinamidase